MRKLLFGLFVVSSLVSALASAHAGAADCQKSEPGLSQERVLAQGLLRLAQDAAGRELECVGVSQGRTGDVVAIIPRIQGGEDEIDVIIAGVPVENRIVLKSEIKPNQILYSILDTDRTSAIEIELKKTEDARWTGELTDIGEPGNPSRTWKLSCN